MEKQEYVDRLREVCEQYGEMERRRNRLVAQRLRRRAAGKKTLVLGKEIFEVEKELRRLAMLGLAFNAANELPLPGEAGYEPSQLCLDTGGPLTAEAFDEAVTSMKALDGFRD